LERLPGVEKVEKGFFETSERNTVYYDPAKIIVNEMENALRKASTYLSTMGKPGYRESPSSQGKPSENTPLSGRA
jgi:hypothetical protein